MKSLFTTLILILFVSASAFARTGVTEITELESVFNEVSEKETLTDNRRPLAIIRRFNPDVFVKTNGKSEWANATVTQPLFNADSLVTNDSGFAMIQFMDNSIVRMRPNSLLIVGGESRTRESTVTRLTMSAGEIFVSVTGLGESTEVVTPSAVAAVRGTKFAVLLTESNRNDDDLNKENRDLDSDNDGIMDARPPDSEPDLDSDNDGIPDIMDARPPDSEPDLDSDNDGIFDISERPSSGDTTNPPTSTPDLDNSGGELLEDIRRRFREAAPKPKPNPAPGSGSGSGVHDCTYTTIMRCELPPVQDNGLGATIVLAFDGLVEVNPKDSDESFFISEGDVLFVYSDGTTLELKLSEEALLRLLDMYTADDTSQESTRTRTLELQFVNENGEIETITIEYEEPIDNE
jgi:hypothetical protein